jgi:hypothetical protein
MNQGFAASAFTAARISPTLRLLKDHLVGDAGKRLWSLLAPSDSSCSSPRQCRESDAAED